MREKGEKGKGLYREGGGLQNSPSYAGPVHPEAVLPDWALCLPTLVTY